MRTLEVVAVCGLPATGAGSHTVWRSIRVHALDPDPVTTIDVASMPSRTERIGRDNLERAVSSRFGFAQSAAAARRRRPAKTQALKDHGRSRLMADCHQLVGCLTGTVPGFRPELSRTSDEQLPAKIRASRWRPPSGCWRWLEIFDISSR